MNTGYIQLGTSHDTSEFACDSLRHWWYTYGQKRWPTATSILALCDGGGSNSSRYYIFKQDLQALADEIGVEIRIAHYPPYCSKYNPIKHWTFPHVTRACQGVIFTTIEIVKELGLVQEIAKIGLHFCFAQEILFFKNNCSRIIAHPGRTFDLWSQKSLLKTAASAAQ
ncbi:MAG: hypothetical protein GVY30_09800 [Chloroflexi bacterium]|nr:hypothetical protein [Chloroflexota bacterium]